MALIDDVHITVRGGNGGNGGTAKKQLFGSIKKVPDGGNGGNGGSVFFVGDANISDLSEFRFKKEIKAAHGVNGLNKDLDGANAKHTYVKVPLGTTVRDENSQEWVEILTDEPFRVVHGGAGGMGNHDYVPDMAHFEGRQKDGEKGQERKLHLILNLIADIGLIGLPNAGKSSLLQALTNAEPKIGNYPFTTLEPNLGALPALPSVGGNIIIADIPGLIEGAHNGRGLGIQFLKHIKKTKFLLHCVDSSQDDILATYNTVREELSSFDVSLLEKKELILLTKIDLIDAKTLAKQTKILKKANENILAVSTYKPETLELLKKQLQDGTMGA